MDRNKSTGSSRTGKSKVGVPHAGSELYALGTKSSSSRDDKNKVISSVKAAAASSERKRESSISINVSTAKKPKLGSSSVVGTVPRLSGESSIGSSSTLEQWEQSAVDCESSEMVSSILLTYEVQGLDATVGLICGAIRNISSRSKIDPLLALSLMYLAKLRPALFTNEVVTTGLVSILKRDNQHAFKGRNNPTAHVLAANLLARGYFDKKSWPESFVKIYIEDAANERVWADNPDCAPFVENICTAFRTRVPPKSMLQPELTALSQSSRDSSGLDDDSGGDNSMQSDTVRAGDQQFDCPIQERYSNNAHIENYVLDTLKEQFNRRQQQDCSTRNFLKFLCTTSGICEVRVMSISRLELWIHNGKLMKPAQELLTYICYNLTGHGSRDHEVLATLVKMRLKTKPLINIYMSCFKEMLNLQPDILYVVLKFVVQNELSNARNPNNMGMLANMFQTKPEESARHLAEIYQEFLLQREDCLRTLRVFLRELVKMLRYDLNLVEFCKTFLTNRTEIATQVQQSEFKDRIFLSIVDLICLCMFLAVSPQVREASVSIRGGRDMKSSPAIMAGFYLQISQIQLDVLTWMHSIVPQQFAPQPVEYSHALHKVLLLDAPEQYSKCDQWPPEPDRALLMRLASETPVLEDSIIRIILIGISKDNPFTVPDTVEVLEQTIRRASTLRAVDYPAIEANKLEIIEFLFSMAEYHHPENIQLPVGYEPPKLAISSLYWKAWNILLMLSAHNPSTFGAFCWERYPMLRSLMEMCITNQFHDVKIAEEELQVAALERSEILEFESHLAAATSKVIINEQNSLLLSQLMIMDPMGVPRRPPNHFLEHLQQLNTSHKLGHLLCRSRKPDLLLDIIQRQGTSQAMPWLADLVQNSEGDFNHLPVQCLCEFLLSNSANMNADNNRDVKLLEYLRKLLQDESSETQMACEVLDYFLRRLASTVKQSRFMAINGLKMLLQTLHKPGEEENTTCDWLLRYLPQIPHFTSIRPSIVAQLRAACQIENNPELVMIYIQFIATHTLHDAVPDMLEHVMDMSQLIVERTTIFQQIVPMQPSTSIVVNEELADSRLQTLNCLFVMFHNYLIKLRELKAPYEWTEYSDLLMVHFEDGVHLPIHLNIIHAFVILLTHSTVTLPNSIPILDYWFPISRYIPQAYTIETNEPVQLLPDWLKLKMIRSPVDRLVDAAMYELTPDQIVLFVQNFGTPITSMSKLLALLDTAVIENQEAVRNAIMNKTYLGHLIEIQQARGAKNGHITLQALKLTLETDCEMDPVTLPLQVLESVSLDQFQTISAIEQAESRDAIDLIMHSPYLNSNDYRKTVQKFIKREQKTSKQRKCSGGRTEQQPYTISTQLLKFVEQPRHIRIFDTISPEARICTLLRTLFIAGKGKENQNVMLRVTEKLLNMFSMSKSISNKSIFIPFLLNKRKTIIRSVCVPDKQIERQNFTQILATASATELETCGRKSVNEMINKQQTAHLVEAILSFLNSTGQLKQEKSSMECVNNKRGILIDWLSEVDSELIMVNTQLQMNLLFTSNLNEFRFYMLSLLCHQAQWATIFETITYLLGSYKPSYDCSSVLNFIEAIIQNPKLWQGREKATPKHEQFEYVLKLSNHQINVFNEYVLNECLMEGNLCQSDFNIEKLNSRLELLLKIINCDSFNLKYLVNYIKGYACPEALKFKYFQQLYLMVPTLKFVDDELSDVFNSDIQNFKGCKGDKVANYIITTTASLQVQKDQILASDAELEVRKLAATHPTLFLRQLSVLASLLQGKAHMSIGVLRSEYHLARFHQILGILELLTPLVFDDVYRQGLHTALDCYFTLLRYHGHIREVYAIMSRLIEFLQSYINANPTTALAFVEQYTEVLQELVSKYRNYSSLQQLVQGLSLLKRKAFTVLSENEMKSESVEIDEHSVEIDEPSTSSIATTQSMTMTATSGTVGVEIDSRGVASFAVSGSLLSKPNQISPHIKSLIESIQRTNVEEVILPPLKEIESLTFKRACFLDGLFDRLLELIFSPSMLVRSTAHTLLVRHLKQNPGNRDVNKTAVSAYVQSLSDTNSMVASSALENLIEIVICLQEFSPEILRTAFDLGIQSKLNSIAQIKRCLQTLKLQHAC